MRERIVGWLILAVMRIGITLGQDLLVVQVVTYPKKQSVTTYLNGAENFWARIFRREDTLRRLVNCAFVEIAEEE